MEHSGTYQAGTTTDERATPEKVVPLRRFFMPDNAYVDRLAGVIDGRTGWVLTYLLRQTIGYHRADFKCSQGQLAKALGYARNTLAAALRELEALHIVTSDAGNLSRTQVRTFHLEPIESWRLPISKDETCSKFEQVETSAEIEQDEPACSENEQVTPSTSAEIEQDASPTCSKFEHLINTEETKTEESKDKSSDANAPTRPRKSSRQKSKLSPEARERHNAEAAYVSDLCKRQLAALKCSKSPRGGEDRAGGHWFHTAGPDGTPADPEQVIALLRVVKQSPHYGGQYLTLQAITRYWPDWQIDPERVRDAIAVERRKADYARNAGNGRTHATASPTTSSTDDTEDALTRKGRETRERLARIRQEREAAEAAAAKGVQP